MSSLLSASGAFEREDKMIELRGKYAQALVYTDVVDGESVSQVINLLN